MTRSETRRLLSQGTCLWAALFAAPHAWWALGYPTGFPGGPANHQLMMQSAWRYWFDVVVIFLTVTAAGVACLLVRPPEQVPGRWMAHAAAWIGAAMLTLRGVAGLVVDGTSDLIWWPTFLAGGLLLGGVAWLARTPPPVAPRGLPT